MSDNKPAKKLPKPTTTKVYRMSDLPSGRSLPKPKPTKPFKKGL